jgi:hypothetical protein
MSVEAEIEYIARFRRTFFRCTRHGVFRLSKAKEGCAVDRARRRAAMQCLPTTWIHFRSEGPFRWWSLRSSTKRHVDAY